MCIIREKLAVEQLKLRREEERMTSLNRLLLAVLQIAQVALIVVVVVYAARDIRKGVSHRVLLGSLVALVVLVAVTPLVTNAAVVEGMEKRRKSKDVDDDDKEYSRVEAQAYQRGLADQHRAAAAHRAAWNQINQATNIGFGL